MKMPGKCHLNPVTRKPVFHVVRSGKTNLPVQLQKLGSLGISDTTTCGPGRANMCLMPYVNNKGADQPVFGVFDQVRLKPACAALETS